MLTVKIDLSKLLKLSHSKSWDPSAVPSIFGELTKHIPAELMAASNRAFQRETSPEGILWQARSPLYIRQLARKKLAGRKLLSITSHLRKSRQTFRTDTTAGIGTNLRYARIHQLGGGAGRGHRVQIPARPYLGLDDYASSKIQLLAVKLLQKHFNGK